MSRLLVAFTTARCSRKKTTLHVFCFRHSCEDARSGMLAAALCKSRDCLIA